MSSALKSPALTQPGPQNPSVPPQMNKPMHPQTGPGPYSQQIPQNLVNMSHSNQNQPHNLTHNPNPHQNHYSLNIPNSYQANPQASSHPVASNHPIANQAHVQSVSYSPPKNQVFNQSYQMQHNSNIPTTQSLPATQAQIAQEPEKPQSNGTTDSKPKLSEQNHLNMPKKEVIQSPEKAKISLEKPADVKPTETKSPIIEPAEVPQNVNISPTPSTTSVINNPQSTSSVVITPPKDLTPAVASTTSNTTSASVATNVPPVSPGIQKSEPSVAATVESSTTANASSPTSTATTLPPAKPVEVPVADPAPAATPAPADKPAEPQEAQSTTADVPPSPTKPKEQSTPTTKLSPMKLATTPRTPTRKSKTPKVEESPKSSKVSEPKASSSKSPGGGKTKRTRTRTQPYQSPLPELEIISKMTSNSTPKSKNNDEKLIIFYKNEFLAVRNSEGGFYVCRAVQNVYKSSPKIKIRWLSQEKGEKSGEVYIPDFYDTTDFDCILTNLNLARVDKSKYRLPAKEKDRTDNILKRAIAVEKGEATSLDDSLTEDNPDGLDVSLYKDEEQLKKRKGTKRKASKVGRSPVRTPSSKRSSPEQPKTRKLTPKAAVAAATKTKTPKKTPVRKTPVAENKKVTPTSAGRAERAKRRSGQDTPVASKSSPVVDQKKAKVLAKFAKRTTAASTPKATPAKTSAKTTKQPVASTSKAKPSVKVSTPLARRTKRTRK